MSNEKEIYAGRIVTDQGETAHLFLSGRIDEQSPDKPFPAFQGVLIDSCLRTDTIVRKGSPSHIADRWWLGAGQVDMRGLTRTDSTGSTISDEDFAAILGAWRDWHLKSSAPGEVFDLIKRIFN